MDEIVYVCKFCGLKFSNRDSCLACEEYHRVLNDGCYSLYMKDRCFREKNQKSLNGWLW